MKKKSVFGALFAALAVAALALVGCGGPSVEQMVTDNLTKEFEALKKGDDKEFTDAMKKSAGESFDQLGVDPAEYTKTYLDGFDYKINSVKVNDKKDEAVADVTVKVKSMTDIMSTMQTKYGEKIGEMQQQYQSGQLSSSDVTQDKLTKLAGEVLVEATKEAKPSSHDIKITYKKNDKNEWNATDESQQNILKALMGTEE